MLKTKTIKTKIVLSLTVIYAVLFQTALSAREIPVTAEHEHALTGEIKKIDSGLKTIVGKTADGAEEIVEFTGQTVVRGAKAGAHVAALSGEEGAHVVVHYSVGGAKKIASAVDYVGKGAVKVTEATLVSVDKGTKVVVMKTADGAEETYHLSERAAIEMKDGAIDAAKFTGRQGDRYLVHYPDQAGRKTVHFLKQL